MRIDHRACGPPSPLEARPPCPAAASPGRGTGNLPSQLFLCFDDFATRARTVVSTVRAYTVRSPRVLAVGARLDLDESQREVGPASTLLRFGQLDLRESHEPRNFTGTGW